MALFEALRRRLSHTLESHQVDEDYSPRSGVSRTHSAANMVVFNESLRYDLPVRSLVEPAFDPNETVPSYEDSQLLHDRHLNEPAAAAAATPPSVRPSDPNVSYSNSTSISRQSSVVAGSTADAAATAAPHQARNDGARSLKSLGLKFLNARQHFALACCRDLSLIPCLLGLVQSWRRAFFRVDYSDTLTGAKLPEHFLTGVWCIVAGYLSFSVLDGLMIRWIVTYSTSAAILRMLSMSTIIVALEQYLLATLSANGYKYALHIWILISCALTFVYIVQNFVTSNLDLKGKRRARFFDFYNIVVFAVVPVGLASFVTMIGLLRSLLIVRLDAENKCIEVLS